MTSQPIKHFTNFHDFDSELDHHRITSGFHGAFDTNVACQQETLTLPDTLFPSTLLGTCLCSNLQLAGKWSVSWYRRRQILLKNEDVELNFVVPENEDMYQVNMANYYRINLKNNIYQRVIPFTKFTRTKVEIYFVIKYDTNFLGKISKKAKMKKKNPETIFYHREITPAKWYKTQKSRTWCLLPENHIIYQILSRYVLGQKKIHIWKVIWAVGINFRKNRTNAIRIELDLYYLAIILSHLLNFNSMYERTTETISENDYTKR